MGRYRSPKVSPQEIFFSIGLLIIVLVCVIIQGCYSGV
jgi:hypothetical protein